ncbi:hypothetical protein [Azohydromonas aeria]|nr:hypothetical protein [Azohydromonas aeria]
MDRHHPIRCAVVALSARQPRCAWLPAPIRRVLDGCRLLLALRNGGAS